MFWALFLDMLLVNGYKVNSNINAFQTYEPIHIWSVYIFPDTWHLISAFSCTGGTVMWQLLIINWMLLYVTLINAVYFSLTFTNGYPETEGWRKQSWQKIIVSKLLKNVSLQYLSCAESWDKICKLKVYNKMTNFLRKSFLVTWDNNSAASFAYRIEWRQIARA